jgi:two-component system, cell cycle response regulator DivK
MAKILLIEDNEMNRDMLSRRLERRGYEMILAVDGAQGVAMAHAQQPDLILMDMSLPVLDGWEATRQLKAAPQTKDIPIIALTAHAMTSDEQKAREAGCDDFDTKPIELPRLLEKMQRLVTAGSAPP